MSDYLQHGRRHGPGGSDPVPGFIYIDDRILDAPTESVVFDAFPTDLHVLEFTWHIALDLGTASGDQSLLFLLMNGDAFGGASEYTWKLAGSVTLDSDTDTSNGGALGIISASYELSWGRIRFPNYNGDFVTGSSPLAEGPPWIGEAGDYNSMDNWVASGYRGNQADPGMDRLEIVCYQRDNLGVQQTFGVPSRFTLTGY